MIRRIRRTKYIVSAFLVLVVSAGFFANLLLGANAAGGTMLLSPGKGSYNVGSSFSVRVLVNSGGTPVNAFDANIHFSNDLLKVVSVDKSTFVSMYAVDPAFSNGAGSVSFSAGIIKGFSGSAGNLLTINFKALKAGTASVSFTSGSILTADGQATNVYAGGSAASYTIVEKPETPPTPPVDNTTTKPNDSLFGNPNDSLASSTPVENKNLVLPPAPEVSSPTHPSVDQWYSKADARFEWKSLSNVIGASVSMNDSTSSDPGDKSIGSIQSKEYSNVANGIHYFHVKLNNKDGWGKTTNRKFMVDTELPTVPQLTIQNGGDSTNPTPSLRIVSIDRVSGISKYKLNLNGGNTELPVRDYGMEPYQLDRLTPGPYTLNVQAIDYAGNTSSSSLSFIIDPLRAPTITSIPRDMLAGADLTVRGTSFYPSASIQIFFSKNNGDPKRYDVKADDKGDWNYQYNDGGNIAMGGYQVWAKVVDGRGAESMESNKNFLNVTKPDIITAYGIFIIIGLIFVIILLGIYIYYLKRKFIEQQESIEEEANEAQKRITEVFAALHEEVDELMPLADKKPGLSETERRVKEKLKEALNISEEFLAKEVEDIEKEVESNLGKKK